LVHPHRTSWLVGLRFSPDGRRLIAGDYPDGLVATWDVASGELATTIETGYATRGSAEYLFVSPDFRTLYVSKAKGKYEHVEEGSKRLLRCSYDGQVRAWDLATGQPHRTFQHEPARNIRLMELSPDGSKFVSCDQLPGTYERAIKEAASLWDVHTGRYLPLPDDLNESFVFSADGSMLAGTVTNETGSHAVKVLDAATGREKLSIPFRDKTTSAFRHIFSPDGRLLVGNVLAYETPGKKDSWRCSLKWWDTSTGQELASFAGAQNGGFSYYQFSPDGQTLATLERQREEIKLLLFRVRDRQLMKTLTLVKQREGERLITGRPAFSADGKWLAVVTGGVPIGRPGDSLDVHDAAQPRILLIDRAGEIRETLVSPPTLGRGASFSPDGCLLATSGHGRVLLWDVTNLSGSARAAREP
jgi:WD40 repeat protein